MRKFILFATLLSLPLIGCSDDEVLIVSDAGSSADASADGSVDGEGGDGEDGDACDGVVVATEVGTVCGGDTGCSEGAQCSMLQGGAETGICRQLCVPGTCETVCAEGEECLPLNESPGTGVCAAPPTGDRGSYESCSAEAGFCETDLRCLVGADEATEGICLPPCASDVDCPDYEGAAGACIVQISGDDGNQLYCSPTCSAAGADDECPGDTTCQLSGSGAVCAFPQ